MLSGSILSLFGVRLQTPYKTLDFLTRKKEALDTAYTPVVWLVNDKKRRCVELLFV